MTTPESEKRARGVLWLLVVVLLAVVAAFLVFRWLDDDSIDGEAATAALPTQASATATTVTPTATVAPTATVVPTPTAVPAPVAPTAEAVAGQTQDALDLLDLPKITFETGSTNITAEGQSVLDEAAAILDGVTGAAVEVGGYTDSQGPEGSNLSLSQGRAEAVMAHLVAQDVDATLLTGVGYGEAQPVADNATAEGRRQNRRIEFTVTVA